VNATIFASARRPMAMILNGTVSATASAPRLLNYSSELSTPSVTGVPFSCLAGNDYGGELQSNRSEWFKLVTVCKLSPDAGGLITPFLNIDVYETRRLFPGSSYLVMRPAGVTASRSRQQ
jgi:hypothetical protein